MVWLGRCAAFAAVVLWAQSYHWSKTVLTWLDPVAAAQARYGLAAAALVVIALAVGRPLATFRRQPLSYLVLGFLGFTGFQLLLFLGLARTSATNTSAIMAMTPLLTALFALVMLREPIGLRTGVGLVVSAGGATLAVLGQDTHGLGFSVGWGDGFVLAAAICMAVYSIGLRRLAGPGASALVNTAILMTIGAVLLLPIAAFLPPPSLPHADGPVVALVCLALGGTVGPYVLWAWGLARGGVNECGLIYNFVPVITMGLAALQGSMPTAMQLVGAVVVILGAAFSMLPVAIMPGHHGSVRPSRDGAPRMAEPLVEDAGATP